MIVTEFYKGQGLGNQLWCYLVTRCIALKNGYEYGIKNPENFKGADFLNLDYGKQVLGGAGPEGGPPTELPKGIKCYYRERLIVDPATKADISDFDADLMSISDWTKIDGNMQDERYIEDYRSEIINWLKPIKSCVLPSEIAENTCVINFRGGEYKYIQNVFLKKKYWIDSIEYIKSISPGVKFLVVTDDVKTAKLFFPFFSISHESIASDYQLINNAKYLIIANTSFAWFPAWTNINKKICIAPKYWWAHNYSDGIWACRSNLTKSWMYMGRDGVLYDYNACIKELEVLAAADTSKEKIIDNFLFVSSYDNQLSWIPQKSKNYLIYERGRHNIFYKGVNPECIIKVKNLGYNFYDYFSYIIENYDALPEVTIFCKGNVFPRHVDELYLNKILNNKCLTPIVQPSRHKTRWPINGFLSPTEYFEVNNSWFMRKYKSKYFDDYDSFMGFLFSNYEVVKFTVFAPGGNYIVPKENILKYPRDFYVLLRELIEYDQFPAEAHLIERAFYTILNSNYKINDELQKAWSVLQLKNKNKKPAVKKMKKINIILSLASFNFHRSIFFKILPSIIPRMSRRILSEFQFYKNNIW